MGSVEARRVGTNLNDLLYVGDLITAPCIGTQAGFKLNYCYSTIVTRLTQCINISCLESGEHITPN
jgi:hypothetical protein